MGKDCVFCRIIRGETPTEILHATEHLVVFRDIRPQAPVHTLIIPKEHFASLNDVPEDRAGLLAAILVAARKIAGDKGIAASGYRIVLNTARDSGQEVFHIHFHLLGGRRMTWPPG